MNVGSLVFVCHANNAKILTAWQPTEVVRMTKRFFYVKHAWLHEKRIPIDSCLVGCFRVIVPTEQQIADWKEANDRAEKIGKLVRLDWGRISTEKLSEIIEVLERGS